MLLNISNKNYTTVHIIPNFNNNFYLAIELYFKQLRNATGNQADPLTHKQTAHIQARRITTGRITDPSVTYYTWTN